MFFIYPSYALKCGKTLRPISRSSSLVMDSLIPEAIHQAVAVALTTTNS